MITTRWGRAKPFAISCATVTKKVQRKRMHVWPLGLMMLLCLQCRAVGLRFAGRVPSVLSISRAVPPSRLLASSTTARGSSTTANATGTDTSASSEPAAHPLHIPARPINVNVYVDADIRKHLHMANHERKSRIVLPKDRSRYPLLAAAALPGTSERGVEGEPDMLAELQSEWQKVRQSKAQTSEELSPWASFTGLSER